MRFEPLNGQVLLKPAECPRTRGPIDTGNQPGCDVGIIEAIAADRPCKIGEAVYFDADLARPFTGDDERRFALIHESAILGVARDVVATEKVITAKPAPKAGGIVVPSRPRIEV